MRKNKNIRKNTIPVKSKNSSGIKILTALVAAGLLIRIIFKSPETIGHDSRYTLFVLILPTLAGLPLITKLWGFKLSFKDGIGVYLGYLFLYILPSFIIFGLTAMALFDNINIAAAKKVRPVTIALPITEFAAYNSSRNSSYDIRFDFKGSEESIGTDKESLEKFRSNSYNTIKLKLRKGIWNHYIVDEWEVLP